MNTQKLLQITRSTHGYENLKSRLGPALGNRIYNLIDQADLEVNGFQRGFMCALACIVKNHGMDTAIVDAFGCCCMTKKQMILAKVDKSDIDTLKDVIFQHKSRMLHRKTSERCKTQATTKVA